MKQNYAPRECTLAREEDVASDRARRESSVNGTLYYRLTETIEYGGTKMEEEYWERFRTTGSVTDYLSYRGAVEQRNREEQKVQGESYGREHYGDRNDSVGTTE